MEQPDIQKLQEEIKGRMPNLQLVKTEMGRVIAGQDELLNRLMLAFLTNGHVLLEGVPGLAKTLAVKTLAQTLNGSFSRVQFTPDLLPADLVGTRVFNPGNLEFSTKLGPIFANIVLADEINRAPAKVQSALLEAMQEKQVTIAGESFRLPDPFLVLATQNPIEQEGTYPLPEAQLDRFLFKLKVEYPARAEELQIVERMAHPNNDLHANAVSTMKEILESRALVDRVYIDEKILQYILDLVIATRPGYRDELSNRQSGAHLDELKQWIAFGASPRASIALALASRGVAYMAGRAYVVPQDVKDIAHDVLRHRLILSYEAEAEGIDADAVITRLLNELRTP